MVSHVTKLLAVGLLALCGAASPCAAGSVRVGGYEFAPYVELDAAMRPSGLAIDLLDLMGRAQSRHTFQFFATSPSRRFVDFADGKYDMILFESPGWGWRQRELPVDETRVFLRGGERYVALSRADRDQGYFASLAGKRMVGIRGYHYGFAGFNADPDYLARAFGMQLVNSSEASIEMVLRGRGDIAVVTEAYLGRYLLGHPAAAPQLLVSERYDQEYDHRILVRRNADPTAAELDDLLGALRASGELGKLFASYGIRE